MSEASDTTAPYSEKNLTDDNFYDALKGLSVINIDSTKLMNE